MSLLFGIFKNNSSCKKKSQWTEDFRKCYSSKSTNILNKNALHSFSKFVLLSKILKKNRSFVCIAFFAFLHRKIKAFDPGKYIYRPRFPTNNIFWSNKLQGQS